MSYRLPLVTTVAVALLMVLGGLVVGMNAALACPDWPLCHGQIIPPLEGPIIVEYFHRLVSSIVGLLIVATLFVSWRNYRKDSLIRGLSVVSIVLLIVIAAAGALIVKWVLPGIFTTIDVTVATLLLIVYVIMTVAYIRGFEVANKVERSMEELSRIKKAYVPGLVTAVIVFAQLVVGAVFRHSGAGEALFGKNDYLLSHQQTTIPSAAFSNGMLVFHIMVGVVTLGAVIRLAVHARKTSVFPRSTLWLASLTGIQMLLGVVALAMEVEVVSVTIHWLVAIAMMAISTFIAARAKLIQYKPITVGPATRFRDRSTSAHR